MILFDHVKNNYLLNIMVVNEKRKFMFMRNPKVASMSMIDNIMLPIMGSEIYYGRGTNVVTNENKRIQEWFRKRKHYTLDDIKDYYKFTFVRNPYDSIVSCLFYFQQNDKGFGVDNLNFDDWLTLIEDGTAHDYIKIHTDPKHVSFLYEGNQYVDFIGRFENITHDWEIVRSNIGLKGVDLPFVNKTSHKPYYTYYNDKRIERVYKLYKTEIDFLGYNFMEGNKYE